MADFTNRQREIIVTSIDLIAENGIQGLTIKNIARKVGVSEPAIYRHFDSKINILLGILSYFRDEMISARGGMGSVQVAARWEERRGGKEGRGRGGGEEEKKKKGERRRETGERGEGG